MATIHSNKCNNSQLSSAERISSRGRGSWITRLITQWTTKIRLTIRKTGHHHHRITETDRLSKTISLGKMHKTQELWHLAAAKSFLLSKDLKVWRIKEIPLLLPVLPMTECPSRLAKRGDWCRMRPFRIRTTISRPPIIWTSMITTTTPIISKIMIRTCKIRTNRISIRISNSSPKAKCRIRCPSHSMKGLSLL